VTDQYCRGCYAKQLIEILDLGFAPPSNALLRKEDLSKGEIHYPLVLLFCEKCKLVQTRDFHSGESLFTPDYPYLSSTSETWIKHSHDLVDSLIKEFNLNGDSLVAEIASNDGYLIERLAQQGIPAYGIEPTKLAAEISLSKGHHVYNCFLNLDTASQIKSEQGTANLVIANNVFAHVPQLQNFTEAAKLLLDENGILVIEVQYFGKLLENSLFDTIYHEHYSYFTLTSLSNLLNRFQVGIFKIEFLRTHGGSIRIYARNNTVGSNFESQIAPVIDMELRSTNLGDLLRFQDSVNETKKRIKTFFALQVREGKTVAGLGAAAKANTLINSLRLGREDIPYMFDSAQSKQGKFLPGSHIPIHPMGDIERFADIDLLVVFPWNLSKELTSSVRPMITNEIAIYQLLPEILLVD
jgi:SAM-dependent methyltransferase